jgi:hypothetical protein
MRIANASNFVFGLSLLLACSLLYGETYHFRRIAFLSLNPTWFPRVILGGLMFLSCCLMWQSVAFRPGASPEAGHRSEEKEKLDRRPLLMQVGFVGLCLAYATVMPLIGYIPATIAFLLAGMLFLGRRSLTARRIAIYCVTGLAVTFSMKLIFKDILKLFLP